ncbi:hypothetical protein BV20DRAFT_983935 [Pilatotrama ljubarskyi]|nr:hypothetical protein BV20DRAFT_983935 [Pilatotrama ljubarskyi]
MSLPPCHSRNSSGPLPDLPPPFCPLSAADIPTKKAEGGQQEVKAVAVAEDNLEVGVTVELPQEDGKLPLVFYLSKCVVRSSEFGYMFRTSCNHCVKMGLECQFRDGLRTSSCVHCQGIVDAEIQACHTKKQEELMSPACKRAKKSSATVKEDNNELMPMPSAAKGKSMEVAGPSSTKRAGKVEKVVATAAEKGTEKDTKDNTEDGGNGLQVSLPREGQSWSADPMEVSDQELLDHLIEGQKTRRAITQPWRFLNEEVELCKELITEDLKVIKGAVTKVVATVLKRVCRLVHEKVKKAFAEHFAEEDEGEGKEGKIGAGRGEVGRGWTWTTDIE